MRWSLVVVSLNLVRGLDDQCKDPLFETHWYGKFDIHTLQSIPTVITDLVRCPQYNSLASCCSAEFELEQERYFDDYRSIIFVSKIARTTQHRQSVADVKHTPAYENAAHTEKEQYHHAIEAFNPVLTPSVHADCFSTLLTYTAGMNCFACRPDWFNYVTIENGVVVRIHVHPSVCMEVWSRCELLGQAAVALKQALLDSVLAKQAKLQAEDLDMFSDQQALCSYLHNEVALHPFQRPSMTEREAAPGVHKEPVHPAGRAGIVAGGGPVTTPIPFTAPSPAAFPTAMPYVTATNKPAVARRLIEESTGTKELDVMEQGKLSGFKIVWPEASRARSARPWLWLAVTPIVAIAATIAVDGAFR